MDDNLVNIITLVWENFPQGDFSLIVFGFWCAAVHILFGKVFGEVPHYAVALATTGIVMEVHIHPILGGEGNSVGKADPVWGEGPCTAVVDCVMCALGLPDHPCVVSSTLTVAFFVHIKSQFYSSSS